MCPISVESPKGKGKSTWFSFDFFKEIIDYAVKNGTKAIKLNYVNEPSAIISSIIKSDEKDRKLEAFHWHILDRPKKQSFINIS